ncbi:MAG: methyltransferase domain-containing protein [Bacteroidales bacterium]|nr:methyltransferase domain-containing protein [Bacteroidales bacterium]
MKSYEYFKDDVCKYLKEKHKRNEKVLDVGAGDGIYSDLLRQYFAQMDAVEIFKPNIEQYKLEERYDNVYNVDIKDFEYSFYDIIIFGDVIEHLTTEDAQKVLKKAYSKCNEMIVAVPYVYKQGVVDGNIYEIHKQDDLTPEIMKERYPFLKLLYGNDKYGYYVKGDM